MNRQVIVEYTRTNGQVTWREGVTVNDAGLILVHHGLDCIIDEGDGVPFENVYQRIARVEWTDRYELFREGHGGEKQQVVIVHSTQEGDPNMPDYRKPVSEQERTHETVNDH